MVCPQPSTFPFTSCGCTLCWLSKPVNSDSLSALARRSRPPPRQWASANQRKFQSVFIPNAYPTRKPRSVCSAPALLMLWLFQCGTSRSFHSRNDALTAVSFSQMVLAFSRPRQAGQTLRTAAVTTEALHRNLQNALRRNTDPPFWRSSAAEGSSQGPREHASAPVLPAFDFLPLVLPRPHKIFAHAYSCHSCR